MCKICLQHRGRTLRPPTRSIMADDRLASVLPWDDVIIDVQGPYTRAEGGEMYVLSYHCTSLKVPKLSVLKNLTAGPFSRSLLHYQKSIRV